MANKGGMPGWLGFPLIGAGALMVWAGFNNANVFEVVASVLQGKPLPKTTGPTKDKTAENPDAEKIKAKEDRQGGTTS